MRLIHVPIIFLFSYVIVADCYEKFVKLNEMLKKDSVWQIVGFENTSSAYDEPNEVFSMKSCGVIYSSTKYSNQVFIRKETYDDRNESDFKFTVLIGTISHFGGDIFKTSVYYNKILSCDEDPDLAKHVDREVIMDIYTEIIDISDNNDWAVLFNVNFSLPLYYQNSKNDFSFLSIIWVIKSKSRCLDLNEKLMFEVQQRLKENGIDREFTTGYPFTCYDKMINCMLKYQKKEEDVIHSAEIFQYIDLNILISIYVIIFVSLYCVFIVAFQY